MDPYDQAQTWPVWQRVLGREPQAEGKPRPEIPVKRKNTPQSPAEQKPGTELSDRLCQAAELAMGLSRSYAALSRRAPGQENGRLQAMARETRQCADALRGLHRIRFGGPCAPGGGSFSGFSDCFAQESRLLELLKELPGEISPAAGLLVQQGARRMVDLAAILGRG